MLGALQDKHLRESGRDHENQQFTAKVHNDSISNQFSFRTVFSVRISMTFLYQKSIATILMSSISFIEVPLECSDQYC